MFATARSSLALLRRQLATVDRLLLPPLCAFCRTPLYDGETGLCAPCRLDMPANDTCCPRCAVPLPADPGAAPCAGCQSRPLPIEVVVAPYRYAFPVDRAIQALKFRGRLEFVPVFTAAMIRALEAAALDIDCLVPVPLHWFRHGYRGFNQAFELARPVADALGLPVSHEVLRRRRTRPQSGLHAGHRRANLRGAFRVAGPLNARHALIVDDVMTTGATVVELARCLRSNGVDRISVLAAARAEAPGQAGAAKV
jgi:ComF family protein